MNLFDDLYKDKVVLVTGHTGFKGSWLALWLKELGATVVGLSLDNGYDDGIFKQAKLAENIIHINGDVRDLQNLKAIFDLYKPEFVFHLAAQAIVRESYNDLVTTFHTNVLGTMNVLECLRFCPSVKAAVMVTSDKCYKNKEVVYGYREDDELGGSDPYSASKGSAELVIASYRHSFFSNGMRETNIASVRAGNVIGGGDWSQDRIIPDAVKALLHGHSIPVRNPHSRRPWQHVLEPVYGYLLLGSKLYQDKYYCGSWNFGPGTQSVITVQALVENIVCKWGSGSWIDASKDDETRKEAGMLNLDSSKAALFLNWKPRLDIDEALRLVVDWYKNYKKRDVQELCLEQINYFIDKIIHTSNETGGKEN